MEKLATSADLMGLRSHQKERLGQILLKYGQNAKVPTKRAKTCLTMNVAKSHQSQVPSEQGKQCYRIVLIG